MQQRVTNGGGRMRLLAGLHARLMVRIGNVKHRSPLAAHAAIQTRELLLPGLGSVSRASTSGAPWHARYVHSAVLLALGPAERNISQPQNAAHFRVAASVLLCYRAWLRGSCSL